MEQSVLTTTMPFFKGRRTHANPLFHKLQTGRRILMILLLSVVAAFDAVAQAPAISSFTPSSGGVGTLVTINGSNLSPLTALTIGGQNAIPVSNNGSTLVAMVMPNATTGTVSLTTAGGAAAGGGNFTVTRASVPSTQQGSKLTESGGSSNFGASAAISADGNTAIVGAPFDAAQAGDAIVYTRTAGVWTQQAKLSGTGSVGDPPFGGADGGKSVAISADGNTAVVGGSGDNSGQGAIWVFKRNNGTWAQQGAKLVGTGAGTHNEQGISTAISADGNTIAVGGPGANSNAGAVWVFTNSNGVWSQAASFTGSGGSTASQGQSVAISADGGTILEGGSRDASGAGAAWVFTGSGSNWVQQGAKLTPSDGTQGTDGVLFGVSAALSADGNTAIIGGNGNSNFVGGVWVFTRSAGAWTQQGAKLLGTGYTAQQPKQGSSVTISADGNTAISGAPNESSSSGGFWIFTRSGGSWTQQGTKLLGTGGSGINPSQATSAALSADGTTFIEGGVTDNGGVGAAWVFTGVLAPTAPTTQATNVQFTNTAPTATTVGWTPGSGTSEAVFISQSNSGSPSPANNTTYNANTAFGSGDQIGSSGWYCVFNGNGTSVNITGLTANTTYNVMVVDYNGTPGGEQYLTTASADGTNPGVVTTTSPPIISNVTFTSGNVTSSGIADYGDQVTLNFTTNETVQTPLVTIGSASSNDNVTLTANGGNSYTATYSLAQWDSPDASGNVPYTIAVTDLSGNTANFSELTAGAPNVTFNTTPSISETGALSSFNTAVNQPSQPQTFTVSGVNIQNDVTVTAPAGFEVSTVDYNYSPNAYLDVTGGGMFGPGTLAPITVYVRMQSSASMGTVSGNITLTSNGATEVDVPVGGTVGAAAPTTQAGNVTFTNTTTTQTTINWTQGNGSNEVVFIAPTDSVSAAPTLANNTTYNASATYRAGGQDGSGSYYCVFNGADGSVSPAGLAVDHLTAGENYTVYVFDYNGTPGSEQYTTANASGNPATVSTLTPNNATVGLMDNGQTAISFTVNFSNPSISGLNVNNFTVSSSVPGLNPVVTTVNYWGGQVGYQVLVSYNSNYNGTVTLTLANSTGITPAVTNLPQSYTFTATVTAPFNQASQVNFSNTTSSATTINWTSGGGSTGEAVFISQGNSGSPSPVNNTTYNANAAFGSGDQIGSSGWYCVYNGAPAASVNVSGLSANTTYNVMVVDYNGVSGGEQYLTSTGWNNPATVTTQSNDATLSNITVSQGSLDQSFSPTTLSYTEELVYDGSPFTLTPVPNNANATVGITFSNIYNSNAPLNGGVFMAYGTNTFNITVTAQDGVTTMAYTVTVTATRPTPTIQASNVTVTNTTQTGTTINWTPGNGTSEAVFLENSSVHGSPSPVNNTTYTPSTVFQSGTQIGGSGWYCIYNGTGSSSVDVTGLSAGSPYQVMVVDYDGPPGSEQYLTASASGNPLAFPTLSAPEIFTGAASGTISACAGTASASPNVEQFSVSGNYLTDNITVTAPAGFELSLDGTTYGGSVTLTQSSGSVSNVTVYARSAASDAAGAISGNAVLSSSGADNQNVALSGTVNALGAMNTAPAQTVGASVATTAVNFSGSAVYYSWTNDMPGIGLASSGSGNIPQFTAANSGNSPVTATVTVTPYAAGYTSYAYIANNANGNVSVINTATGAVVSTITVGSGPYGVAASADGTRVYVTNSTSGTVSVINTLTNTVIATVTVGKTPQGIAVTPDGSKVYVANDGSGNPGTVMVFSGITYNVINTITLLHGTPKSIVASPDGSAVYVGTNNGSGGLTKISTSTNTVISTDFPIVQPQTGMAITPDGSTLYTGFSSKFNFLYIFKTNPTAIYTGNLTFPTADMFTGNCLVVSPDGATIYLGINEGAVWIVNIASKTITAQVATGSAVRGISLSPDGSTIYAVLANGTVDVINAAAATVTNTITVGNNPVSFGNFISTPPGCPGAPTTFTITVNPSPTITTTNTLTALSTTAGTASASNSFNVSATWLQSGIVVTPPAGFEVSTDGNTYSGTVTLTGDNTGTLASTTVYVRLAAADAVGSYSGNIQITSTNATTATEAVSGTVLNPAPATVASNVGFTNTTTTATTINWTPGNGSSEVVFIASAPAYPPLAVNNTTYTASTAFGTGSWQCVFNGSGNSVNVTGLTPGATYNVYVFDYDGTPGSEQYLANLSTNTGAVTTVSTDAALANFTISNGTLSPGFSAGTFSYTDAIANLTSSITVVPTADNPNATITVNGTPVASGVRTAAIPMALGSNTVTVVVTAQDNTTTQTYTVTVNRPLPNNATLTSITLSPTATLTGTTGTGNYNFTAVVANGTTSVQVRPTAQDPLATVTVNGQAVGNGALSQSIPVNVGPNVITTVITAQDGVTTKTAIITVNRAGAAVSTLAGLAISQGTLSPAFAAGTSTYTASVPFAASTVSITPTTTDPNATVTVNGIIVTSGTASAPVALVIGANKILTVVTAQNGTTKQTYTTTITRGAASTNALLTAVALSPATALVATTGTGYLNYTASVSNSTVSVQVKPTATDPTATITVNGSAVTSGTLSQAIALSVGSNTITTVVTAQDGVTTKTAIITVTRAASSNANLAGLSVSSGTLSPVFSSSTNAYTASVPATVSAISVTPATSDPTATIMVNNLVVSSGAASQSIPLAFGANTITTVVTAQDGVTTQTYTLTVTRVGSSDALLTSIKLTPASALTIVTGPSYVNYTTTVPNATGSITVTATEQDPTATITVNGVTVASGVASASIPLNVGSNVISIVSTAQDGVTTKTYTITATRTQSTDALLTSVKLTPTSPLTIVTGPSYVNYTATVANTTSSVTVTATEQDPTATITINGVTTASGVASASIPLVAGSNVINVVSTAQDGVTAKTYTITITRAPSTDALLTSVKLTPTSALTIVTGSSYVNYTTSVVYSTSSVTVTATEQDPTATVTINGVAATSGVASASIPLSVGSNVITVVSTAQDGVTSKTYTITATRAPSTDALLTSIKLTPASTLTVVTGPSYVNYTTSVPNSTSSVTVTATEQDPTATLTVNGVAATSGVASAPVSLAVGSNTISIVSTAQDGVTIKTYTITATRAIGSMSSIYQTISVTKPAGEVSIDDGIVVHQAISPNGDGINDYLTIDGITNYPDNRLMIVDRNGAMVYQTKGYDNSSKVFDGHSSINGKMQLPGTYFYSLDYTVNGENKHKTGYIILKY